MAFYPDWVVLLEDTAKSTQSTELTPRTAQKIIDAIKQLQRERDEARAGRPDADHECDLPPGITASEQRYYKCTICGAHWVKVKRMVGRQMLRSWHRMSDEQVRRLGAERQNTRPA